MSLLAELIVDPVLIEIDHVDVAASPARAWETARHFDLARSSIIRTLFAVRVGGGEPMLRLDDLFREREEPGFRVLAEEVGSLTVGAIGKVWKPKIPYLDIPSPKAFAEFAEEGWIKVAWELRVVPRGEHARIEIEVRVGATDEDSWRRFRRYFLFVRPGSLFIRRHMLSMLAQELGDPIADDQTRTLPGDELLSDAVGHATHGITIQATPAQVWPWLVQMGCGRAGFYSYDWLDNAGVTSAKEIHPEWQHIAVGDVLPAAPGSEDGFEVLRIEAPRLLLLGGLFDPEAGAQRGFGEPRPERYWHVTWAFQLEPLDAETTRLVVRGRVSHSPDEKLHAAWIGVAHHFMQSAQLRRLKARVEGSQRRDGARDVLAGLGGIGAMIFNLLTPFSSSKRARWGVDEATADRVFPGDERIASPRRVWTHGIEIDATPEDVWPWIAQLGADRGGFYSLQWLENLAGCDVTNAEAIHPELALGLGDGLVLHPAMPALPVVSIEPGRHLLAHAEADAAARERGEPWLTFSWLFFLEPLGDGRTRLISRARSDYSNDLATRIQAGPTFGGAVDFVMDRALLEGVKRRVERRRTAT